MYDWNARHHAVKASFVPWIERARPLSESLVVEFGCGTGAVACALSPYCAEVVAVDIDADTLSTAEYKARVLGCRNIEFKAAGFEACLAHIDKFRGQVDVFMLYAVLEHMTLDERLRILAFADSVLAGSGVIVVCESPNRLVWNDFHTSQTPFNFQLPEDLSLRYTPRLRRADFVQAVAKARASGAEAEHEAFVRWGRGISYHEFELAGMLDRIVVSNFEPELMQYRHVERDELALARFFDRMRDQLPRPVLPCFGRYYIDCIIARDRPSIRPRVITPWGMETLSSSGVAYTAWETLLFTSDSSVVVADLPEPTNRILLGIEPRRGGSNIIEVGAAPGPTDRLDFGERGDGSTIYCEVRFTEPTSRVIVHGQAGIGVSFLGSERTL